MELRPRSDIKARLCAFRPLIGVGPPVGGGVRPALVPVRAIVSLPPVLARCLSLPEL